MAGVAIFNGRYNVAPFNGNCLHALFQLVWAVMDFLLELKCLADLLLIEKRWKIAKAMEGIIGHIAPPTLKY
jgi:hypothetical protein